MASEGDAFGGLREYIASLVRDEVKKIEPRVDGYLTVNAAAKIADVSPGTVRRWLREGDLTRFGSGRLLRVKRSELDQLLVRVARGRTKAARDYADESPDERIRRRFG